ncbi:signal peptidase I [Herbivorax sp. ANBcel31]|uniref:signal peptidase I n=1 Tax=Herbivorax sp. ANBcel31 TaxID=3069754 RepID=UPI0027B01725|nr:signal peptidase I [Herbivorax sp. ANBcel31]MDQ2087207.1 signal peptidase I [Herbivorax sp. ANBcel31]
MEYNKDPLNLDKIQKEKLEEKYGIDLRIAKPNYLKELVNWCIVLVLAVIIALILRNFAFEWVVVRGQSMEESLSNDQVLFVNKLGYIYSEPKRGDIVIMQYKEGDWEYLPYVEYFPFLTILLPPKNEQNYVKRVIGVPGDVVDIRGGHVYINDVLLNEPYAKGFTYPKNLQFPQQVPADSLLLLGDNRENSEDSRQLGFIDYDRIKGKAAFRLYPIEDFGSIYENLD